MQGLHWPGIASHMQHWVKESCYNIHGGSINVAVHRTVCGASRSRNNQMRYVLIAAPSKTNAKLFLTSSTSQYFEATCVIPG